jgi:hypothetical protein
MFYPAKVNRAKASAEQTELASTAGSVTTSASGTGHTPTQLKGVDAGRRRADACTGPYLER